MMLRSACSPRRQPASTACHPIINSNINNFCSPDKFAKTNISRINPDKSTFLNSNLLVSNILNHLPAAQQLHNQQFKDAYESKDIQMIKIHQIERLKKQKVDRVRAQAKRRAESEQELNRALQKELGKQIEQIQIMKLQMQEKSRDIMGRKEDTAYLGRNIFLEGQHYLKQMKDSNPADKTMKTEATRMLMKECAKKKGRNAVRLQQNTSQDASQILNCPNSSNISMEVSLEASNHFDQKRHAIQKDKLLTQMIKSKSFDNVMKEQRRYAAWEGFSQNWAMGFFKNQDVISTKKKRKNKRSPKKYCNISENNTSVLQYHDLFSRHQSLKKYKDHFNQTASSYSILTYT